MSEITYDEAARMLDCSPRHVRRVLRANGVRPIIRGHRTVRFPADKILRLKLTLIEMAHLANGRKSANRRAR